MSDIGCGKGERLSNVATHSLTQGSVPPFHMGGLSSFFATTMRGFCREDVLRGGPQITERMAVLVFIGDGFPHTKAGGCAAVANGQRHDVACPPAHRCPPPSCASFFQHTTPPLIEFKNIICRRRQERICSRGPFLDRCADPPSNRLSGESTDALNSAQTATLQASPEHRVLVGFRRGWLWRENAIGATVLAMLLRISTTMGSIFDDRCTFTDTADVRHGFLNHDPNCTSSLTT
jgi:hypothetical protein